MALPIHSEEFTVRSYEIDIDGRLTLPSLFCYLQESASNHAYAYGLSIDKLRSRGLTWMISRIHIRMKKYPKWGEVVTVETWPSLRKKYFAFREFLCSDAEKAEICRATSSWLVVDLKSNRPAVLEERGIIYELPDRGRVIEDNFSKIPSPDSISHSIETEAFHHTIDYNDHVGSVQYLKLFFDPIPCTLVRNHMISSLEVRFQYQALLGDKIRSDVKLLHSDESKEGFMSLHELYNITRGKTMALARANWCKALPDSR